MQCAVALTALSVFFAVSGLTAEQIKRNDTHTQGDGHTHTQGDGHTQTQGDGHTKTKGDAHTQTNETDTKKKNQPHIVFILIDDQGYNDIGYHNPTILTPTLDKLAAEGVKLENYYVQPICTPSRSQLITGRYQIHTGLQHSIIRPRQPSCLPSHMDTLPERLQQAGYATHMVGKWHLGFYRKACLPTRKGFDSFFGSLTGSVDYYSYGSCDGPGLCGYDLHEDEGVAWGQEGRYSTTLFTQRARRILENHRPDQRPLFLLLSLQAVHTPLQTPKSYLYPYRDMANVARRKYAAMVSTVDEAVRNVTYALRKLGYYRNSVIVYSTDNGAQPFTGGSNWPLRGRKGTYWEGGMRGVAFVHSPLIRRRRRVSRDLLHITDWFPTLVGLAGGNISQSQGLDGFDVWPTISEGKASPRQEILHNIDPLHKPAALTTSWDKDTKRAQVSKPKGPGPALKKPKRKKILKQKPKQKSAFRLKNIKKSRIYSPHAAKPKPKQNPTSKPKQLLKPKLKPLQSSKLKPIPKPKKTKLKVNLQSPKLSLYQPLLKSQSSGIPSASGKPPKTKSKPKKKPGLKSKSKRRTSKDHHLPKSRPPRSKSKITQLKAHFKSKSKQALSQYQNVSRTLPKTLPKSKSRSKLKASQSLWDTSLWDTSVQAAIRVGDWKLLTGDPGHGDWVPPQVLSNLVGPWWNLERSIVSLHKPSALKSIWLFNITADPYERWDVSEKRPDVVHRLLSRLAFYNRTAVPVYFPPDDPRANPERHEGAWVPWVDDDDDEDQEDKYKGVYKKGRNGKKKKKKKKCKLCKLQSFFLTLNTRMISNKI